MKGSGQIDPSPQASDAITNEGRPHARPHGRRSPERRGVSRGTLSEEPTLAWPEGCPLELAVGPDALRHYEAALLRLRPRDRRAVRGRIEQRCSYDELAAALRVTTASVARTVVIRALERLVEVMAE